MNYRFVFACLMSTSFFMIQCMDESNLPSNNAVINSDNNNFDQMESNNTARNGENNSRSHHGLHHKNRSGFNAKCITMACINTCVSCENMGMRCLDKLGCDEEKSKLIVRGCCCVTVIGTALGLGFGLGLQANSFNLSGSSDDLGESSEFLGGALQKNSRFYNMLCGVSDSYSDSRKDSSSSDKMD